MNEKTVNIKINNETATVDYSGGLIAMDILNIISILAERVIEDSGEKHVTMALYTLVRAVLSGYEETYEDGEAADGEL